MDKLHVSGVVTEHMALEGHVSFALSGGDVDMGWY